MIPLKLTLRNFMSYGDTPTTLPFEGLHVACLSGDNGNGKSALLDAMTWVLWDKTRASSSGAATADDLIRQGADEVEVRFEFELSGQHYRVTRKRKRGRTGEWLLTQKNSSGDFVPAGGNTVRETARQLPRILRMEYETFLNSAYLQQGRADAFTRQKPNDRKRILGEILGLEQYERLEELAKAHAKTAREQADDTAGQMRILQGQIERIPTYTENLETAQARIAELTPQVAHSEKSAQEWRGRVGELEATERQAETARAEWDRVQKERLQAEQELAKKAAQVQSFAKTLEQKSAILKDFETLQTTKRERERLEPDRDQYDQKQREVEKAEAELRIERTRLEGEVRVLKSQIAEVESKKRELENLLPQIERLEAELLGREAAGKALREAREEATRIEEQFAEMKSHNKQLKEKAVEYREAIEVLEQPLSACPVCDTALDEAKKSRVITRQKAHLDETQKALEQIKKEGNAVLEAQKAIQVRVQELEQKEKQFVQFSTQLQGLATRKAQLQKETTNSEALHANRTRIERELEQDAYSPGKHIALRNLKYHLQELKPKWEQYEVLTRTLRNLEGAETRHQNLLNTEANNTQALREQETLAAQKERYWRAEQEAEERYRKLLAEVQGLPALRQKSLEAERALSSVRDELGREKSNAHVAEVGLAQCSQDQQRYKTLEKEHEKQNQEAKYYNALASAFGRKGIQTMIIDNLLPEIQDDANELLGRMTDGEMKVSLTTTRDRKSGTGGAIETLDINITDGAGTRPYELFSGGEGFRVNFALRLSLSRLLARRSGARLETLIIDEGFGSQDGKGRERLVEVIEAVKEDFQKILVITHFEEMKDAFPQRIEIVKEANGSRIHLL